jgi:hypothetical protein
MVKQFKFLLVAMVFFADLNAQDYLSVPITNPVLFPAGGNQIANNKVEISEENFIFLYDTLDLPFIDDFSTNRQRKRITDLTDSRLTDSVFYKLFIGGRPFPDTVGFTEDSTFKYLVNQQGDTNSRQANLSITIQFSDLTDCTADYQNYVVFPAYNYSEQAGVPKDTVYVNARFRQDSVTLFTVAPNPADLWTDASTYINRTFGLNPPSIGVATFDGLDELGQPYGIDKPLRVIADYLSSVPLDLENVADTNVYLSFFYQPKGLARDGPERGDSLVLEFYNASTKRWAGIWNSIGFAADTFAQEIIKVPVFLQQDGFRFRFKNYANSAGAFDQWHIDYIYLDDNRTETQEFYNDIAYVYNAPSMLKDYYAMPYWHFRNNPSSYMADSAFTIVNNASDRNFLVFNFLTVPDPTAPGSNLYKFPSDPTSSINLPQDTFQFRYPTPFEFPAAQVDTAIVFESIFDIQFRPRNDFIRTNDTVISRTVLQDYYAYDDGTAEAGYGVNPALSIDGLTAYMAVRYDIPFADTLKGFQTYFLPQKDDVTKQKIVLSVWSSLNPTVLLYERTATAAPVFSETNGIVTYTLDTALVVGQTFYIGFKTIGANSVNVGYDLNTNHKDKVFFSQNGALWTAASAGIDDGALMLRPVFRNRVFDVGIKAEHLTQSDLTVFPNPTNGILNLRFDGEIKFETLQLFDVTGKQILNQVYHHQIDLSSLPKGIYFLKVQSESGHQLTKKVILSQ